MPSPTFGQATKPRAIIAAAERKRLDRFQRVGEPWQDALWEIYAHLGPVHYGMTFKQSAAQRVDYFAAEQTDDQDEPIPTEDATVIEAVDRLGDLSAIVGEFVVQENVAGEGWLVGEEEDDEDVFTVMSSVELQKAKSKTDGEDPFDYTLRIWRPAPWKRSEPDSPLRSVQAQCEQLLLLNDQVTATAMSRIPAGLLFLASEFSFGADAENPPDTGANIDNDPFMEELVDIMTIAIKDPDSAARVAPNVIRAPVDLIDKGVKFLDMSRSMDETFAKMREELLRQIAGGINLPAEILTGLADLNHWPCDEATEVYTENGWATYDQLKPGTRVMTLDIDSGQSRFERIDGVRAEHVTDRPMLEVDGSYHSSLTTPDHRWPVERNRRLEWAQTENFLDNPEHSTFTGARRYMVLGAPHADLPDQPKLDDRLVELMAWCSTDGDVTPESRGSRLRIRQRRRENFPSIEFGLGACGDVRHYIDKSAGVNEWVLSRRDTEAMDEYGARVGTRWMPYLDTIRSLTAAQLERLLVVAEKANGGSSEHRSIFSSEPTRLEPFEHAAHLLGYRTTLKQRSTTSGWNKAPMWRLSWGTRTRYSPKASNVTPRSYTGVIFCPKVPVGKSFLARRNGFAFYTGNSLWGVDESTAKHHVDPDVLQILQGLTEGYLWPALEEGGMGRDEARRFKIWRDYSDLTARPMTVEQALALNVEGIIDDEYVRRVANVPEKYAGDGAPKTAQAIDPDPTAEREPPIVAAAVDIRPLTEIDRDLATSIIEASEAAFTRALERAGVRIRNKARKDRQISAAIDGVSNEQVTRQLGAQRVEQLQLTADQLLPADTFNQLESRVDKLVAEGQEDTRGFLAKLFGKPVPETDEETDRRNAVSTFINLLFAAATARLFTDSPALDPAETGEFSDNIATAEMVVNLLTEAGGGTLAPDTPRGLALGQRTRAAFRDNGYRVESLTWKWGYYRTPRTPFEPHENLNGDRVLGREDPRLDGYYPGDHRFCTCELVPSVLPV